MVIKVSGMKVQRPTLLESVVLLPDRYYVVDRVPELQLVVQHLMGQINGLDPSSVVVEPTNVDANELEKREAIFKIKF